MHLEGLVTCLDFNERKTDDESDVLMDLYGVFQRLPSVPDRFIVYFDVRRGAADSADVNVRLRKARGRRRAIYETGTQLVLAYAPRIPLPVAIEDARIPSGGVLVEVLIDNRVAGSRMVQFGHEQEET